MARSRLKRSRLNNNSNNMANTIKRLKHSLACKDRRIRELESNLKDFKELYNLSKDYYSWCEYVESTYRCLKDNIQRPLREVYQAVEGVTTILGYNERRVAKLMQNIDKYNKKENGK